MRTKHKQTFQLLFVSLQTKFIYFDVSVDRNLPTTDKKSRVVRVLVFRVIANSALSPIFIFIFVGVFQNNRDLLIEFSGAFPF